MVGLAVLGLLSEVAGEQPLISVIDDEQWLDQASEQTLTFAARRLAADPVGLVFAAREPGPELAGLPELALEGLHERDARALLDSALAGPLDARVRELIVAETRGNPLALLELPRGLTQAELAGGFGLPGAMPLTGQIEDSFRRQLEALPADTRRLLVLAAADPSDPSLMWRAAGRLGIPVQAAQPAQEARLADFRMQVVRFRHPLARSAAYRSAPALDRRDVHGALAKATRPGGTNWGLGVEARCRVLVSQGRAADALYREAIDRLGRTRLRPELARAHLLYGEWLRRENRRTDAREQLRNAHYLLSDIGMEAFAERARRELAAVGETVRKRIARAADASQELTAQEAQVARLARDGLSNPEIGARLFISSHTVQYHLSKVFAKLSISSRRELHTALATLNEAGTSS